MIYRHQPSGPDYISQTEHARIAAFLLSKTSFYQTLPSHIQDILYLATLHHDDGWIKWEQNPTINPHTSFPYDFKTVPTLVHLEIWKRSREIAARYGDAIGYFVSLHNHNLYHKFNYIMSNQEEEKLHQLFLTEEKSYRDSIQDPLYSDQDFKLYHDNCIQWISMTDYISLVICMGIPSSSYSFADANIHIKNDSDSISITPYIFSDSFSASISVLTWPSLLEKKAKIKIKNL
ncbi:hypothetical protein DID78_04855 [Candidatus Marinamargulisbacteria bacterium SCGC AG-343-D04]|nr:hypothetical protein DID78_04855 [Candidatus Marinamargulisbacteria bacterium SCGC AG-343-D04]